MSSDWTVTVGKHFGDPVIQVRHADLTRSGDSMYRSVCPVCGEGFLLVYRDGNFELRAIDNCILCGQRFEYTDIEDLRKGERTEC